MATEVHIALQPQAGQDPAAALTAAAAKLARASLDALIQQSGQPISGKIVAPPPNFPPGLVQVAVADRLLALKLSTPLPAGTPVRIDVQQTQTGQPAVTVQPMPNPAPQAPVSLPQARPIPTPSLPLPPSQQAPNATVPTPPPAPVAASSTPAPSAQPVATSPTPQTQAAPTPQPTPPTPAAQQAPAQPVAAATQQAPPPAPQAAAPLPSPTTPLPQPGNTAPPAQASVPPAPQPTASNTVPVAPPPAPAPAASPPAVTAQAQPAPTPAAPAPAPAPAPTPTATPTAPSPAPTMPAAAAPAAPAAPSQPAAPSPMPQPQAPTPAQPQTSAPPQVLMQRLTQAFAPPPGTSVAAPAVGSASQLVMAATTQAAAQQQSPAPLLQSLAASMPTLPTPVAEAAARVLSNRVNLDRGAPTGEALKQAVLKSGVFLDAPAKAGSQPDIRQALNQLRGTLQAWLGDDIAPVAAVTRRPPPPTRSAVPRGQTPELPQAVDGGSKEAGKSLLGQTEGALARVKLMQLSSGGADATRPGAHLNAPTEWNLELPMMLGRELTMAQIQIERDGKNKTDPKDKSWRLRFALKFSVLGEVGAQITMVGDRTNIGIWADEAETAAVLESMLPELAPSLAAKGLELTSLTLRRSAPRDEAPQPAGRLMDSTR